MAQVRRVRRIIRRFDPWTVFKVSAVGWAVFAIAMTLGLVMFWSVFQASGIPDRVTSVLIEITLLEEGSDPFGDSDNFLRLAIFGSIVFAVLATGLTTLGAVMYNLIADVVGGVEFVVLEESIVVSVPAVPTPVRVPSTPLDAPTEETPVYRG